MERGIENLKKLIHQFKFSEIEELLLQHAQSTIRVETTKIDEDDLAIGKSKLGGRPDLPKDMDWVTVSTQNNLSSLPFIAQINLEEVSSYDIEDMLPKKGILYFFADYESIKGYKVIFYTGAKSNLERKDFPEDLPPTPPRSWGDHRFEPCAVTFIPEVNLPHDIPNIDYPEGKTWEDFYELVYASNYTRPKTLYDRNVNRLLGFPYDVPSDMQLDCQVYDDTGKFWGITPEEYEIAKGKKLQWQLLLQIGSDQNANMAWSDMGTICFYIKKQDLEAQNFNDICFTMFTA